MTYSKCDFVSASEFSKPVIIFVSSSTDFSKPVIIFVSSSTDFSKPAITLFLSLIDVSRVSLENMTNDIFRYFEDNYNEFSPQLIAKYNYLKSNIRDQKDENANLLKQIDLLKQEMSLMQENSLKLSERLQGLENISGFDKNDVVIEDDQEQLINVLEHKLRPNNYG